MADPEVSIRPQRERTHTPGEPTLIPVEMHLHAVGDPFEGVVVSTKRCTASTKAAGFVRHLAIDISASRMAGRIRPGQAFGVIPPGLTEHGQPHKLRLYSVASPTAGEDGHGNVIATTVKRLIDEHHDSNKLFLGVASNFLCDLRPGDKVKVTGPSGKRFVLPADTAQHDYLFFATGTGIAPFRGMLLDLARDNAARPSPSRVALVMGSPYASDLLYHDELQALARQHPWFTYLSTLSRERQPDGKPPMYVQDRIAASPELLLDLLESPRTLVYICGIAGMELGIFRALFAALSAPGKAQYLAVDADIAGDTSAWSRKMVNKQVRPTRRVFLEVY